MDFPLGSTMHDASPVLAQAVAYLEEQELNIIFRWVQIASRLPAHFRRPDEDLKALVDHMPLILADVRRLMLEPVDPVKPVDVSQEVAMSHAVHRYQQRVSARTVVKEYQLLRHEIWATLWRWPQAPHLSAADCFLLEERLNFPLDEYIAVTLDTFVHLENESGHVENTPSANNSGG